MSLPETDKATIVSMLAQSETSLRVFSAIGDLLADLSVEDRGIVMDALVLAFSTDEAARERLRDRSTDLTPHP